MQIISLLQQIGNISTLGSFFAQDAADDLLQIGAKTNVKLQEDFVIVTGRWNSQQMNANFPHNHLLG